MYQQNRPQMPMPGMMQGVSPLSGLTDGDEIMAEEQRMGRNPASQAEQMLQQQPAADRYRMEQFQKMDKSICITVKKDYQLNGPWF